ncbi:hypothetical protein TeGR_g806, partial [Tetraparma gracilis]
MDVLDQHSSIIHSRLTQIQAEYSSLNALAAAAPSGMVTAGAALRSHLLAPAPGAPPPAPPDADPFYAGELLRSALAESALEQQALSKRLELAGALSGSEARAVHAVRQAFSGPAPAGTAGPAAGLAPAKRGPAAAGGGASGSLRRRPEAAEGSRARRADAQLAARALPMPTFPGFGGDSSRGDSSSDGDGKENAGENLRESARESARPGPRKRKAGAPKLGKARAALPAAGAAEPPEAADVAPGAAKAARKRQAAKTNKAAARGAAAKGAAEGAAKGSGVAFGSTVKHVLRTSVLRACARVAGSLDPGARQLVTAVVAAADIASGAAAREIEQNRRAMDANREEIRRLRRQVAGAREAGGAHLEGYAVQEDGSLVQVREERPAYK